MAALSSDARRLPASELLSSLGACLAELDVNTATVLDDDAVRGMTSPREL